MVKENNKGQDLSEFICSVEGESNLSAPPSDIDSYLKYAKQVNENIKVNAVLSIWEKQQEAERNLRSRYAKLFILILAIQLLVINVIFVFIGAGALKYEQWTINIFILSVFGEIVGIVLIIVKNLFTSTNKEMIDLVKEQK